MYWRTFLAPPSFTGSIVLAIYCQFKVNTLKWLSVHKTNFIITFYFKLGYPAGYGIAVVSFVQMAILCITGQNVIDRVRNF